MNRTKTSINSIVFISLIIFGIILRFNWPFDIEYKADEEHMFTSALAMANDGLWPRFGMMSGGGILNPGLSKWFFGFLAFFAKTPIGLTQWVMFFNSLVIVLFSFFATKIKNDQEREKWLWGIALFSISPMAILFSRKLWAQNVLPLFVFPIIFFNYYRKNRWCCFMWGIFSALVGQIHISGFFFAFAIMLGSLISDYLKNSLKKTLFYFSIGVLIGALPAAHWVNEILFQQLLFGNQPNAALLSSKFFNLNFFRLWLKDSFGFGLYYTLGGSYISFLKGPVLFGINTYLLKIFVESLKIICFISVLWFIYKKFKTIRENGFNFKDLHLVKSIKENNSLNFYIWSVILFMGLPMAISGMRFFSHYLIVLYPLPFIFVMTMVTNKKVRYFILLSNLFISISFQLFIHNNGPIAGDYGSKYNLLNFKQKEKPQ